VGPGLEPPVLAGSTTTPALAPPKPMPGSDAGTPGAPQDTAVPMSGAMQAPQAPPAPMMPAPIAETPAPGGGMAAAGPQAGAAAPDGTTVADEDADAGIPDAAVAPAP
jgi:hypothetical protein